MSGADALRWGTAILALGYVGMGFVSIALVGRDASPETAVGRHLWAGALANAVLAAVEIAIVLGPLRRGEAWAFFAALAPLLFYGLPVLVLDATHVARENVLRTLAPQLAGIAVSVVGLSLVAIGLRAR